MVTDETCIVGQKRELLLVLLLRLLSVLYVGVSVFAVLSMHRIAVCCCMCCHVPVDPGLCEKSVGLFSGKRKSMQLRNFKNGGGATEDLT